VRVSRFAEGLSVIKQCFTSETVTFSGTYYTMTALRPVARPVQHPHPPILIGSAGRRMLSIAALTSTNGQSAFAGISIQVPAAATPGTHKDLPY
jgi:alkanesulfonate monooxygenase SsuD/methylene tetrahydromethanopterin reductase-like flavin-dependent oxidoreductase (luciferase family)